MKVKISDCKFRNLNVDNIDELKQISKIHLSIPALWKNDYNFEEIEIDNTVNDLQNKSEANRLFCKIVEYNNEIISYIWAETDKMVPSELKIISFWTKESFRKRGIGTSLKILMEDWAKSKKMKKIVTTVSPKNVNMVKLNENLGYEISSYNMVKII